MAETTTTASVPLRVIWTDPFNTSSSEWHQQPATVVEIVGKLGQEIVDKVNDNFALKEQERVKPDDMKFQCYPPGIQYPFVPISILN